MQKTERVYLLSFKSYKETNLGKIANICLCIAQCGFMLKNTVDEIF